MVLPALMGVLIVPGGALLSAPFIDEIGEEMKIPAPRSSSYQFGIQTYCNVYTALLNRTIGYFRCSSGNKYIKTYFLNLFYVIPTTFVGYFLFIKDIKYENTQKVKLSGRNLTLLLYTSQYIFV